METLNQRTALILALAGATLVAITAMFTPGCTCGPGGGSSNPIVVEPINYHGWTKSLRLRNKDTEVIVVPEIGRVMSFRLLDSENIFWEERSLDGKNGDASGKEWINFGGDKTWPAPESEWGKYTGHKEWMPPSAFDALPVTATITNNEVTLTSPVDAHYGIRTVRRIRLYGTALSITTSYERISGEPSKIGIWVITQFKDPVAVFVPVKTNSIFANGYFTFSGEWPQLQHRGNRIEITRDPKLPHKMGSDAHRLAWVGEKEICTVASWGPGGNEYPDRGASAEVYTNPDPKKYVELEMLGPLSLMKPGDRISQSQNYSLRKRTKKSAEEELKWLFP